MPWIVVVLLLCSAQALSAAKTVSVRTLLLSPAEMPELYFLTQEKEPYVRVKWSERQPSKPVAALCEESLPLYRMELDPSGKPIPIVAKQIKLPVGAKEVILLAWQEDDKISYHAIGDDYLGRHFNHWLLINFSRKEIAFRVGDDSDPVLVKTAESKIYKLKAAKDKGATVIGQARIKGEIKMFYSSYFPVKDGRRTIVLFTDDGEKIRTRLIADHFLREEKKRE